MAYSRWTTSVWYTYADANGGFTVVDEKNFSDEEMKNIDKCLEFFNGSKYSREQIEELREYMEYYAEEYIKQEEPITQTKKALLKGQ